MASIDREALRMRARRAYEWSRLRSGFRSALLVLPMAALSLMVGNGPVLVAAAGAALFVLVLAFRWRGEAVGHAVVPGLAAGSVPLVLPLLLRGFGHCCIGGWCWSFCLAGCIGGGLLAGVAIGVASAAEREHRWTFLAASTLLAGFAGMLGCAVVGVAGIAGMGLAVIASSLPVAMMARPRLST